MKNTDFLRNWSTNGGFSWIFQVFLGLSHKQWCTFQAPSPSLALFPYVCKHNKYIYIECIYIYTNHMYIYIYYTVSYLDLLEVSTNQYYWFSLDKLVWIPFYYQLFSMHGLFMLISYTYHQKQIKNKLDNDWTYISQIIHLIIRTKIHPMPQNNTEICPKINRSDNAGPPGWENWGL